jgi:hypothetical protein
MKRCGIGNQTACAIVDTRKQENISREVYDFLRRYYARMEYVYLTLLLSKKGFSKEQIRQQKIVDPILLRKAVEEIRKI